MQTTFPRLLRKHATERPQAPAMREKEYGIWQSMEWAAMLQMVTQMACGLHQAFRRPLCPPGHPHQQPASGLHQFPARIPHLRLLAMVNLL